MARLARREGDESDLDEELTTDFVHRWVELPSGKMELQEFPLTPEYFLDPQIGDQVVQSFRHWDQVRLLYDIVDRHAHARWENVIVLSDQKLLWGHREWRRPSPDIAVIPEYRDWRTFIGSSFNVAKTGLRPCLIIEVVSFSNAAIRDTDLVDKVELYERERIREYLAIDPPQKINGERFQWIGYRLDERGRYLPIEPDDEGRIASETTGLAFGVSPDGQLVLVFDARTGERLLTAPELFAREREEAARQREEAEQQRKEAERQREEAERQREKAERQLEEAERQREEAERERAARENAEAELVRLREEIARLKGSGG
jgi:Uma2 family endonuclease